MNLAAIDLNLLVAFDALMQTRSVSHAAERMGVRQPAMSASLSRLRRVFGDELFVRAAGAMQPTPFALRIGPAVAQALAALGAALDDAVPFRPDRAAQTFRIASTDYTSRVLLPGIAAAVSAAAPGAVLQVIGYDKGDVPALLDRGDIDLALGTFPDPPSRAVQRPLYREHFVGVARRGHPAIDRDGAMALSAYLDAAHALVSVRRDRSGAIDVALAARGLTRRIMLILPHMAALPAVLGTSDLIAAMPERAARDMAGEGLVSFPLPISVPDWFVTMLRNETSRSDPAHGWLRGIVARVATAL